MPTILKFVEMVINFISLITRLGKPSRCVDGRGSDDSDMGPQELGGSIHMIFLLALFSYESFTRLFVRETCEVLINLGFPIGGHRDEHANAAENVSGCGFADKLVKIFKRVLSHSELIISRIVEVLGEEHTDALRAVTEKLAKYNLEDIKIDGEDLILLLEQMGGQIPVVKGVHEEGLVFVNLVENTTFNTNEAVKKAQSAFNLDLWAVLAKAKLLKIDNNFAFYASLILYVATEMVLVEDKGNKALDIRVNKKTEEGV